MLPSLMAGNPCFWRSFRCSSGAGWDKFGAVGEIQTYMYRDTYRSYWKIGSRWTSTCLARLIVNIEVQPAGKTKWKRCIVSSSPGGTQWNGKKAKRRTLLARNHRQGIKNQETSHDVCRKLHLFHQCTYHISCRRLSRDWCITASVSLPVPFLSQYVLATATRYLTQASYVARLQLLFTCMHTEYVRKERNALYF